MPIQERSQQFKANQTLNIKRGHESKMDITKNMVKIHRLGYRFLNSYHGVWFSFWKTQTFDKSLEGDLRLAEFFLEIFKIHRLECIFL
jgi:hypothetical protein